MRHSQYSQRGAAAIFIVIFFAILISIIALSFFQIALQDQEQATNNDLSQSAYDSADAGLEDAKRAISWYDSHCPLNSVPPDPADGPHCTAYKSAFDGSNRCNLADIIRTGTLPGSVPVGATSEVKISTNPGPNADDRLDQAYTCVNVKPDTDNYIGTAENGKNSTLISLRTVNNASFDTIEFSWFTSEDNDNDPSVAFPTPKELPTAWPAKAPPVIRFELIPVLRPSININDIDADTRTAFLYPSTSPASNVINLSEDNGFGLPADSGRAREKTSAPQLAKCETPIPAGYACSVKINQLPLTAGSTPPSDPISNTDYYLRITAFYKQTTFEVRLLGNNGTDLKKFNNVEPEVDSTGRANDVFRRVQTRVERVPADNSLSDGGFDIAKGVCKDFHVPVFSHNCTPAELIEPDPAP